MKIHPTLPTQIVGGDAIKQYTDFIHSLPTQIVGNEAIK